MTTIDQQRFAAVLVRGIEAGKAVSQLLCESVAFLAQRGFHTATIARITGFSPSQVSYRVQRLGLRLRDYRDGDTPAAKRVLEEAQCRRKKVRASRGRRYRFVAP